MMQSERGVLTMQHFPIFLNLAGRRVIVSGGGECVLAKLRLRAAGHVIADQYAMARRAGFDEVEISPDLARRQPQEAWVFRADWRAYDYQNRLRGE